MVTGCHKFFNSPFVESCSIFLFSLNLGWLKTALMNKGDTLCLSSKTCSKYYLSLLEV